MSDICPDSIGRNTLNTLCIKILFVRLFLGLVFAHNNTISITNAAKTNTTDTVRIFSKKESAVPFEA